jgi:phospholipase C
VNHLLLGEEQRVTTMSRRRFLAATGGAILVGSGLDALAARAAVGGLPVPGDSGIDHVVVVMMENRSFDHVLGWLPEADGRQSGLSYRDTSGRLVPTYPLAPDFSGCGFRDPDHSYEGGRVEYDDGRCDGWLRVNDVYSIGYYERQDLAFLGQAAHDWTTCDRYFAAIMGPTFPNRMYQHAGVTDRLSNTLALSTLPTIWDRLAEAGLDGRYYFGNLPFLALWGTKYLPIVRPFGAFLADCVAGTLPQVAFVDPTFTIEGDEPRSDDDHPHADIRAGESFLARIYAPSPVHRTGGALCWSSPSTNGAGSSTTYRPRAPPTSSRRTNYGASASRRCSSRRSPSGTMSRTRCSTTPQSYA